MNPLEIIGLVTIFTIAFIALIIFLGILFDILSGWIVSLFGVGKNMFKKESEEAYDVAKDL